MPSVPPRTVRVLGLVYSVQGSPTIQMVGQAGPICGLASVFRSFRFPKGNQDYKGDKAELKASIFSPGHTPLCLCPPAWASITQPALVTLPGPGGGPAPVLTYNHLVKEFRASHSICAHLIQGLLWAEATKKKQAQEELSALALFTRQQNTGYFAKESTLPTFSTRKSSNLIVGDEMAPRKASTQATLLSLTNHYFPQLATPSNSSP